MTVLGPVIYSVCDEAAQKGVSDVLTHRAGGEDKPSPRSVRTVGKDGSAFCVLRSTLKRSKPLDIMADNKEK